MTNAPNNTVSKTAYFLKHTWWRWSTFVNIHTRARHRIEALAARVLRIFSSLVYTHTQRKAARREKKSWREIEKRWRLRESSLFLRSHTDNLCAQLSRRVNVSFMLGCRLTIAGLLTPATINSRDCTLVPRKLARPRSVSLSLLVSLPFGFYLWWVLLLSALRGLGWIGVNKFMICSGILYVVGLRRTFLLAWKIMLKSPSGTMFIRRTQISSCSM